MGLDTVAGEDLLEGLLEGRLGFAGRAWDGDVRVYRLAQRARDRPLTLAERNVVALLARGGSNAEVGYVLGIKESTVSTHIASACRSLNARVLDLVALGPLLEQVRR